jgi:hypothetical protein
LSNTKKKKTASPVICILTTSVLFSRVANFEYTSECIIFDILGIPMYHGWLVDPQSPETQAAVGHSSYNQLVEKIISQKSSEKPELVTEGELVNCKISFFQFCGGVRGRGSFLEGSQLGRG